MTRRPPSLRRLAILLTLPVLLVAGMGVWVIRAERVRVEAGFIQQAAERADALLADLRGQPVQDAVAAAAAQMPRWRFLNEEMPGPSPHYPAYEAARKWIAEGKLAEAAAELRRLADLEELQEHHSPGGLPMPVLLQRALMDAESSQAEAHARKLVEACQMLPSPLTGRLLRDARSLLPPGEQASLDEVAEDTESLFHELIHLRFPGGPANPSPGEWAPGPAELGEGNHWLGIWHIAWLRPDWVQLTRQDRVGEVVEQFSGRWGWLDAQIAWRGRDVMQFGSGETPALVRESGPWRVAVLKREATFQKQLEERTNSLKWILANVLLVVVVAMWLTFLAFKKQVELARMQAEFVASVSHELRTPVAGIGALAERLESGMADVAQTAEYHRMIAREGRRLAALVDNVLDFSRMERGAKAYDLDHADLPGLIRGTAALMRPTAEEKGLALNMELEDVPEHLWPAVDAGAMRQALLNLLDNAIKFTPAGGTLTVGFSEISRIGVICISVRDTGIGISASEQARIFEKFYRVDNGLRRETTGAGIGLSIVKHIAEAHRAKVTVESEVGKYSVFSIQFSVVQPSPRPETDKLKTSH